MKDAIFFLIFFVSLAAIVFAQNETVEYNPQTVVYHNETCMNTTCYDIRLTASFKNLTRNMTTFDVSFTIMGEPTRLSCRLRNVGAADEYGSCLFDFPKVMWEDMIINKIVPLPLSEQTQTEEFWNKKLITCENTSKFYSSVILYGGILVIIISCVSFFIYRWKKYGLWKR